MGVSSGSSNVADVEIHVFGCVVSPEWFSVRSSQRVTRTGWEADIRIVDGGHAITWGSGSSRISEVFAKSDILLPETGRLFHSRVRKERSTRLAPDGRVEYQTCFEAEKLDSEVFALLTEELTLTNASDLLHRSVRTNRLAPSPVSRLHIDPRRQGLSIQSFHTFPTSRTIVRIQSLFEIVK